MHLSDLKSWRAQWGRALVSPLDIRESLQWLGLARLGVLFSLVAMFVAQQIFRAEISQGQQIAGWALLAFCFGANLLCAVYSERFSGFWIYPIQIVCDVLAISAWIALSDVAQSLFILLYLIQILIVSLIFYQRGALIAAALSCLGLGVAVFLSPESVSNSISTWAIYSLLFFTLGLVGGYLSEELLRTSESLKEKQRKIEKLTALHERILKHMPTGLLTVDQNMRINFINQAGATILEKKVNVLVGKPLLECSSELAPFFGSIAAERVEEQDGSLGAALSATGDDQHRSFFFETKDGHARLQQRVEIHTGAEKKILRGDVAELEAEAGLGSLLDEEASGGRVLLFQDVTKLLQLEEKVKQHEKLAAVGQLAAGIAHEIRNPLASMSASIELLKSSSSPYPIDSENQRLMDIALKEIDRLNRLVSEFLDYVKPERMHFESVDLAEILSEVISSVRGMKDHRENYKFMEQYTPHTKGIGNSAKLRQVIWNLIINGLQAMGKGGRLHVGCSPQSGDLVKFWVEDEGCGMGDPVLQHLFEPFFTTKERGTGLGLATVYKIVEAHRGEVRVRSTVNEGTRIEVWIPSAEASQVKQPA